MYYMSIWGHTYTKKKKTNFFQNFNLTKHPAFYQAPARRGETSMWQAAGIPELGEA